MTNPLLPDGPFVHSKWIWAGWPEFDLLNSYVHLRKSFRVRSVPPKALVHVTADTRYRLYVNGRHVSRGPARGFQISWPYDTVDIAPCLKKGKNVIAAKVHCLGLGDFQYIHHGIAGFLLAGAVDSQDLATNDTWKARRAPGHLPIHTRLICPHLGWQEYFDARLDNDAWLLPNYDDSKWDKAIARAFGCMPWHNVEPRGIPLLREQPMLPAAAVSTTAGKCNRGYAASTNLVALFCEEGQAADQTPDSPAPSRWKSGTTLKIGKDWATLTIPATGKDRYTSCCIDFGREVVGSLRYRIEGATGSEILDTVVTEGLNGLAPVVLHPDKAPCGLAMGNRLFLAKGTTEHEQFDHWGFRYVVLIVRNTSRPLTVNLRLHWVGYPLDVKSSFESSDERLNKVYQISAWTQQCCMLDAYMDCPWREQAQWWGDARVQAKNTFYLSADARLLARGIRQIGTQQIPSGLTYAHAPTIAHGCILPDFTLTWVATLWDYYWQTGDLSLFESMQHRAHHALDYFHRASDNRFGLLPFDDRYWLFLDWCPLFKDGYPTLYNVFYLLALQIATRLFKLIGDRKSAAAYAQRADILTRAIERQLFNRKQALFYGGLDWKGKPVPQDSGHVAALAILTDLLPQHHDSLLETILLPIIRSDHSDKLTPSPFFTFYMLEALKKLGRNDEVIDCISRWWGEMVDRGLSTTEEGWNSTPGAASLCHAWSAHPVVHLSNILLGIWQETAGWTRIRFAPTFTRVDCVRGKVATPLGVIESGWTRTARGTRVFLRLPKGMMATAALPGRPRHSLTGQATWAL